MSDLERAKNLLLKNKYTCVLCKSDMVYTFTERGVKPLLDLYKNKSSLKGFSSADKVVGKGAAFLYLLLEVEVLYAGVISQAALELLTQNGVFVQYDALVNNIINRKGDGICPFEKAVLGISDKNEAYEAILQKAKQMSIV